LGNKQIVFEQELKKICDDMEIDIDMVSRGLGDKEGEYKQRRQEIVNKLCRRICCKQQLITYVSLVSLIKG